MGMRTLKKRLVSLTAIIALTSASALSLASSTVTATFDSSQPNTVGTVLTSNYNDGYNVSPGPANTVAGIYNFTVNGYGTSASGTTPSNIDVEASLGSPGSIFHAVCIDFTHNIYYGQQAHWIVEDLTAVNATINGVGISSDQAKAIAYLWTHNALTDTADHAAEFQLAVWDILYNGGGVYSAETLHPPTVSYGGAVAANGDVVVASNFAATAWANRNLTGSSSAFALVSIDSTQSFTFVGIGGTGNQPPVTAVPLPASASVGLLMLGGFGGLAALRKSRRKMIHIA